MIFNKMINCVDFNDKISIVY